MVLKGHTIVSKEHHNINSKAFKSFGPVIIVEELPIPGDAGKGKSVQTGGVGFAVYVFGTLRKLPDAVAANLFVSVNFVD